MVAGYPVESVEAGRTAPTPNIARFASKAPADYAIPAIGSNEFAVAIVAQRCRLSAAVARRVVELIGMGGAV